MRTEPSFCIFVSSSSPSNPDIHAGDVVLRIDDLHAPLVCCGGQAEQQLVLQKCTFPQQRADTPPLKVPRRFSAAFASLAAPTTVVVQRGQAPARDVRIKPDSSPHPHQVLDFFEGLQRDDHVEREQSTGEQAAPKQDGLTDPYVGVSQFWSFISDTVVIGIQTMMTTSSGMRSTRSTISIQLQQHLRHRPIIRASAAIFSCIKILMMCLQGRAASLQPSFQIR